MVAIKTTCVTGAQRLSSHERLHPFTGAADDMLLGRNRPDEHRAVEPLADDEIGKLRGGATSIRHA